MKTNILFVLALALLASCVDGTHKLYSPDKGLMVEVLLPSDENRNTLGFNVYKNDSLISENNLLGLKLDTESGNFHQNVRVLSFRQFYIDNVIETTGGSAKNQANGIRFMLANLDGENMDVVFRIYNNAIAYQYELFNDSLDILLDEYSQFSVDPQRGIHAFALSDTLLEAAQLLLKNNLAMVDISSSKSTELPPRYILPWRFLLFEKNAKDADASQIKERLLAQTEFAY